jgi:HEAT repeat protein
VRQEACNALKDMNDKGGVEALVAVLDDSNETVYDAALLALGAIDGKRADQAALAALKSKHGTVRDTAARGLGERKTGGAVRDVWEAYTKETEGDPAMGMAWALIELKFADPSAAGFLAGRLEPKTNKNWFQDVRLLKQLSGKDFGPPHQYVDEKERDAALAKWRDWAKTKPAN